MSVARGGAGGRARHPSGITRPARSGEPSRTRRGVPGFAPRRDRRATGRPRRRPRGPGTRPGSGTSRSARSGCPAG
ncbi:hypothetical protein B4N89_23040 [Embleya scabrispora]|uniref:Uncharacterized protein n=1 Tax=Embleya scabrispora TaxID=159449 RepID=A0A1T3P3A8_9ACTN|nr:hypothetical protein B4N89_23040 [Embleya scabrispora]